MGKVIWVIIIIIVIVLLWYLFRGDTSEEVDTTSEDNTATVVEAVDGDESNPDSESVDSTGSEGDSMEAEKEDASN